MSTTHSSLPAMMTLTAPAKFDRRAIALSAWSLVKNAGKTLSEGMKAAWAAAKKPAAPAVVEIQVGYGKAAQPASYKQYCFIMNLDNVLSVAGLNATQFSKRVNSWEASEAIGLAQAGKQVRFVLA